jgi:hypothetical protein
MGGFFGTRRASASWRFSTRPPALAGRWAAVAASIRQPLTYTPGSSPAARIRACATLHPSRMTTRVSPARTYRNQYTLCAWAYAAGSAMRAFDSTVLLTGGNLEVRGSSSLYGLR